MNSRYGLASAALLLLCCGPATAQSLPGLLVTVDEDGHGTVVGPGGVSALTANLALDTGPGGQASVLTYNLLGASSVVAGDVVLTSSDEGYQVPVISDLVRFNPDGTLVFYSDNAPVSDSLADVAGPPSDLYANTLIVDEMGLEGFNGAVYTPGPADPGSIPGFAVTYHLVSDTPEPGSVAFLLSSVTSAFFAFRRHASRRQAGKPDRR